MNDRMEPGTTLSVTLSARGWNSVLALMSEGIAAASVLLGDIQRQCVEQSQQNSHEVPRRGVRPNGVDAEVPGP